MMKEIVEEHKQSYDENNMRDFIDVYLKEMKEGEASEFTGISTNSKWWSYSIIFFVCLLVCLSVSP